MVKKPRVLVTHMKVMDSDSAGKYSPKDPRPIRQAYADDLAKLDFVDVIEDIPFDEYVGGRTGEGGAPTAQPLLKRTYIWGERTAPCLCSVSPTPLDGRQSDPSAADTCCRHHPACCSVTRRAVPCCLLFEGILRQ